MHGGKEEAVEVDVGSLYSNDLQAPAILRVRQMRPPPNDRIITVVHTQTGYLRGELRSRFRVWLEATAPSWAADEIAASKMMIIKQVSDAFDEQHQSVVA